MAIIILNVKCNFSGFVTKSYNESWDSSCEKSCVLVKKNESELKMPGPLCNQTVNLKTDSKTLYCCIVVYWH